MDATLHLTSVTQPERTDADEADPGNRRLVISHLPSLFFFFVQQDLLRGEK